MRVVFTGGGTAGHVLPNIAVIEHMRAHDGKKTADRRPLEMLYIGSKKGPEKILCERYDVPFASVSTGKLRRYFSLKNFIDPFRVVAGVFQAWQILRKWRPDVVFSKGGFVSVPVVLAAATLKIPVIVHEADITPGLANRICARFAKVICVSWEETMKFFSSQKNHAKKIIWTGMPVRQEILHGVRDRGLKFLGFEDLKPVLLVMGGSLGAKSLNSLIWRTLEKLVASYNVVHLTGNQESGTESATSLRSDVMKGYRAYQYLHDELFDVYAASDVVVSRAGASAIAELAILDKSVVFIPLGTSTSRGDQIKNAEILQRNGAAEMLLQGEFTDKQFIALLNNLAKNEKRRESLSDHLKIYGQKFRYSAGRIAEVIMEISFRI